MFCQIFFEILFKYSCKNLTLPDKKYFANRYKLGYRTGLIFLTERYEYQSFFIEVLFCFAYAAAESSAGEHHDEEEKNKH